MKCSNVHCCEPDGSDNSLHAFKAHHSLEVLRDSLILIAPENSGSKTLTMGQTTIYPGCRTSGHRHQDREEVYYIIQGKGVMIVGEEEQEIGPGDAIHVPYGEYHATRNIGRTVLECIWVTSTRPMTRDFADGSR